MPSGFLDCPAEIRIKFYRYCLFLGEPVEIGAFRDEMPTLSNSGESVEVCASSQLLRVCHQVLKEAEPILYSENTFSILSREGVNLFCAQAGRKVELIQKISICSLTCTFIIDQTGPGRFTTRKLFAPFRGLKEVRLQICNPIPTGQFEYDPAKNCLITSKDFTLNLSARFFDVVNAYVTELLSMGVSVLFDVSMGPIVFLSATNNSIATAMVSRLIERPAVSEVLWTGNDYMLIDHVYRFQVQGLDDSGSAKLKYVSWITRTAYDRVNARRAAIKDWDDCSEAAEDSDTSGSENGGTDGDSDDEGMDSQIDEQELGHEMTDSEDSRVEDEDHYLSYSYTFEKSGLVQED